MRILLLLCLCLPALGTNVQPHVIDRSDASISDYPYVLSLRNTGSHSCEASLIGTTRAVTAAHCVGSSIVVYTILGGTSDRRVTDCATCVLTDLNFLNRHPAYDGNAAGYPNDVAVIGFPAVNYNANLQPIELGTSSAGGTCTIVGWFESSTTILQAVQVTVLTNTECAGIWGTIRINDGNICVSAGSLTGVCNTAGGSPLECNNQLAGASSWGEASCDPSYPLVYTRISYFYTWIIAQ